MPVMTPDCPKCHKTIPFADPNFCSFCGHELDQETKNEYTFPKCPPEVKEGHCEDCKEGKFKACDACGGKEDVEYRPKFDHRCLCWPCRQSEAMRLAHSRGW